MASEIRVNKIENRSGLGTVTFADTGVDLAGIVTATTFSGSGASLTNLPAGNLSGTLPAISATNLTNVPAANITGTLPAISAANLTNVPAANITGTLPALTAANLTNIPAANLVGVATAGLTKTGGFGAIIQVLQTQKTDTFTSSNSTWVDITGLSQSITMTSASNKVLVQVNLSILNGTTTGSISALKRGDTFIGLAQSGYGSRQNGLGAELYNDRSDVFFTTSYSVLDTPGTGTHTYKVVVDPNSYTVYVNRSEADGDTDDYSRGTSDIILMEIAA